MVLSSCTAASLGFSIPVLRVPPFLSARLYTQGTQSPGTQVLLSVIAANGKGEGRESPRLPGLCRCSPLSPPSLAGEGTA